MIADVFQQQDSEVDRMAWPKKHTRKIVVDGHPYQWHRSRRSLYVGDDRITVGTIEGKFFLYIDPFPHDFEMRPCTIADAIRWAVANGWDPDSGPTRQMTYPNDATGFMWLPDGARCSFDLDADDFGDEELN